MDGNSGRTPTKNLAISDVLYSAFIFLKYGTYVLLVIGDTELIELSSQHTSNFGTNIVCDSLPKNAIEPLIKPSCSSAKGLLIINPLLVTPPAVHFLIISVIVVKRYSN